MKTHNKKYCMIVYAEDERYGNGYGLEYFSNNPAEGILNDIVFGDNVDELKNSSDGHDNEGLFYILYKLSKNGYRVETGKKISYGTVDWSSIEEEIEETEITEKQIQLNYVLDMNLSTDQLKLLSTEWKAFYENPDRYKDSIVIDCVKEYLREVK